MLAGCPDDDRGDTDGAGTTTEGGSSSSAASTGSDTSDAGTSTGGEEPTSTGTGGGTTGDTTGGTTGGEGSLCEAVCAHSEACGETDPECVQRCLDDVAAFAFLGEGCGALHDEVLKCESAASCESLGDPPGPCESQLNALDDPACVLPACTALCDKQVECGHAPEEGDLCGVACSGEIGQAFVERGQACVTAIEAMILCGVELTCEQLEQGVTCEAEVAAQEKACGQ